MINKSADLVVKNLLDLIIKGEIKSGEKLKSAQSIAEQLGVSLGSVREAMQSLETIGLIQIIHGKGIFLTQGRSIIEELLEIRRAIEPFGAAMAAKRIDDETLLKMSDLLEEMDKSINLGIINTFNEYDYQFHLLLGKAAGNRFLFKTLMNIRELLRYQVFAVNAIPALVKKSVVRHREIFEAVKKREPQLAMQAMEQHIAETMQIWKETRTTQFITYS